MASTGNDSPTAPWLRRLTWALATTWFLALTLVFAWRVGFPLELEWMEGGSIHQALRLQQGLPIYPPPSADFVPFLYTPLYPAVLALLGFVFPLGLPLGRIVSLLAWAGIGWGLWRALIREGKAREVRAAALGLWCSSYVFTFRWVDLARADTLMMALALWALVLLRDSWGDLRKAALAGLLMGLAFWTKQTAAIFVVASVVAGLLVAPRQLWLYVLVVAVVDGVGMVLGNRWTDGWLWRYVFELHQAHAFNDERFTRKTWGMFVHAAPWLVALAGLILVTFLAPWLRRQRKFDARGEATRRAWLSAHRGLVFWGLMALSGALASALGYSTQWAEPNAFIPGACLGALWLGVGMPEHGLARNIGLGLACAQMLFSLVLEPTYQPIQDRGLAGLAQSYRWQDLSRTVPSSQQRHNAAALRDELRQGRDEVLALGRPYWSILAGGSGHVGSMGISDVGPAARAIERELADRVRRLQYDRIWFEGEPPPWIRGALRGRYGVARRLQGQQRVRPMSGWMSEAGVVTPYTADQVEFVPIAPSHIPAGAKLILDFEDGTLQRVDTRGGFGPRPVSGFTGGLPQPAGVGGAFWLSSAGSRGNLAERGEALSGAIEIPAGHRLETLIGVIGEPAGLFLELVDRQDTVVARFDLPKTQAVMTRVGWTAPSAAQLRLRARDESDRGAILIDDVWVAPS